MSRRRARISNTAAGLIVLALVAISCWWLFGGRLPRDHYEVVATFRDALDIKPGAPVRIAGVTVGKVAGVDSVSGGRAARVRMRVEERGRPLHRDGRFVIRPRIFLEGNQFVEAQPGSPSAPELDDGATVPITQTATYVPFSDVTRTLTADTRRGLQEVLAELERGLARAGARGFNDSMRWWAPAYRDSALVADGLAGARGDLRGFVRSGGTVAQALDRDPAALQALVVNLRRTAGAFARERTAFDRALAETPPLLRSARPALAALNDAFPAVRRLARDARPGVRAAAPGLRAAVPLAHELGALMSRRELGGLAADLRRAVPPLARAARGLLPALRDLRATSACQTEVVLPAINAKIDDPDFPATGRVYEELGMGLPGLAGESRSGDANGQWIRVMATAGNYAYPSADDQFLITTRPLAGANPRVPARGVPPFLPDVPCETQQPPDLRSDPAPPPPGFKVARARSALEARGVAAAQHWLRRELRRFDLDGRFRLRAEPLRSTELKKLPRSPR